MDSGPAPSGASRNDEWRDHSQYASFSSASSLVWTRSRLCSILPSSAAKSLRSCADRHDRISCSLRNRRGISSSYSVLPLRRQAQPEFAAVVFVLDTLDELPFHQRGDGAADGRFVGPGAMRDVLRAAGIVAEAERRQHPPFRNVEPVALLIFARQRGADLGRQPVQAERHEAEEIEPSLSSGAYPLAESASTADRVRGMPSPEDVFAKNRSNLS